MFKFGDYIHVKKAIFPKCGIVLRSYIDDFGFLVYDVLDTNGDKLISAHVESAYEDEIMRINEYISKEKIEREIKELENKIKQDETKVNELSNSIK